MPESMLDDAVLLYVNTFEMTESETYYFMMSLVPMILSQVGNLQSFDDAKAMYLLLGAKGFTVPVIANYVSNYIQGRVAFELLLNETLRAEMIEYYEDQIAYYQEQIQQLIVAQDGIEDAVLNYIDSLPLELHEVLIAFWYSEMTTYELSKVRDELIWDIYSQENGYLWNSDTFWTLAYYKEMMYSAVYYENPEVYTINETLYNDLWNSLSVEEQALYTPVLNANNLFLAHRFEEEYPLHEALNSELYFNHYQYVSGMFWNQYITLNYEIESKQSQLTWLIYELENPYHNDGPLPLFALFFENPDNVLVFDRVLLALLTRLDVVIQNVDSNMIDHLIYLIMTEPEFSELSSLELEELIQFAADFLELALGNVNPADLDDVQLLLGKVASLLLSSQGMSQEELDAFLVLFNTLFDNHVPHVFDSVGILVTFLDSITAVKIDTVLYQVSMLPALEGEAGAIAIATIITTLLGDETLDYDSLISYVISAYYDVAYMLEYNGEPAVADVILYLQTLIDDIIAQADVIDNYNALTLVEAEIEQIMIFVGMIEELMFFLDGGPESLVLN